MIRNRISKPFTFIHTMKGVEILFVIYNNNLPTFPTTTNRSSHTTDYDEKQTDFRLQKLFFFFLIGKMIYIKKDHCVHKVCTQRLEQLQQSRRNRIRIQRHNKISNTVCCRKTPCPCPIKERTSKLLQKLICRTHSVLKSSTITFQPHSPH